MSYEILDIYDLFLHLLSDLFDFVRKIILDILTFGEDITDHLVCALQVDDVRGLIEAVLRSRWRGRSITKDGLESRDCNIHNRPLCY
jgi:hypothetical protein